MCTLGIDFRISTKEICVIEVIYVCMIVNLTLKSYEKNYEKICVLDIGVMNLFL